MHLDLVDVLRCPADHEESPVVALPDVTRGRTMIAGTVGCPVCSAEYSVVGGVLRMGAAASLPRARTDAGHRHAAEAPHPSSGAAEDAPDMALRLAAMLDLTPGRPFAVIAGRWGAHAYAIRALTPVPLVLLNPPAIDTFADLEETTVIEAPALPFLGGSVTALAADSAAAEAIGVDQMVAALSPRARLVLPDRLDAGKRFDTLATDAGLAVHERVPDPLVVTLGRGAR